MNSKTMGKNKSKSYPQYIAYWCSEGLESLINIPDLEKAQFIKLLKAPHQQKVDSIEYVIGSMIQNMELRSRFNPHRNYELYAFSVQEGINKEDIEEAFKESPQTMVDTIRRIGVKIFSHRNSCSKQVIN